MKEQATSVAKLVLQKPLFNKFCLVKAYIIASLLSAVKWRLWCLGGFQFTRLSPPRGFKDLTPSLCAKYRYLEESFYRTFTLWGYREVRPPLLEHLDLVALGVGEEMVDEIFKLQDSDGKLLALRAEATTPVARLYADNLREMGCPARIFYIVSCLRFSPSR
ncbi:MAG: hypothetical protein DRJ33_05035, partial [Candidatus Methanomethylicota archaeon]